MLQFTPQSRIFLAVQPVDIRKGIDGLAALCRQTLQENPSDGAVYVFRNRTGTTLKLLAHGRFHWWPTAASPRVTLSAQHLSILLWNGHPDRTQLAPDWRPIRYEGTRATG